jgi:hypothetical protein
MNLQTATADAKLNRMYDHEHKPVPTDAELNDRIEEVGHLNRRGHPTETIVALNDLTDALLVALDAARDAKGQAEASLALLRSTLEAMGYTHPAQ